MMYMQAPDGTTIVLPSAQPDNTNNNVISVNHRRTMNNILYAYVKNTGRIRLVYKFVLFRGKALELQAFTNQYLMSVIRLTDYIGRVYLITFSNDPFEFISIARDEITEITLTVEGVKL